LSYIAPILDGSPASFAPAPVPYEVCFLSLMFIAVFFLFRLQLPKQIEKAQKLLNDSNSNINYDVWNGERVIDINYQGKYFCTVSRNRVFNKNGTTLPPAEDKKMQL
jgi:hypothetical protein